MENDSRTIVANTETIWHVVVIGKSGTGKSATCNTLLGGNGFESKYSNTPTTRSCKIAKSFIDDIKRNIMIIDTPGIFDVEEDADTINAEMKRCIELSRPGFNAILMVISLSERFTSENQEILKQYKHHFGFGIMRYVIVVFTNAERLEESIDEYVAKAPPALKKLLKSCGDRYFAIENKNSDNESKAKQRKGLLSTIKKLVQQNEGCMYTDYNVGVSKENTEYEIRNKLRKEMQPEFDKQEIMVKKEIEINESKIESESRSSNVSIFNKFFTYFPSLSSLPSLPRLPSLSSPRNVSGNIGSDASRQQKLSGIGKRNVSRQEKSSGIGRRNVSRQEKSSDKFGRHLPSLPSLSSPRNVSGMLSPVSQIQFMTGDPGYLYSTDLDIGSDASRQQKLSDIGRNALRQETPSGICRNALWQETPSGIGRRNVSRQEKSSHDGHAELVDGKIDEEGKKTHDDTGERKKHDSPETTTLEQKSCDPCSSYNVQKKGVYWCQECEEYYCVDCFKTHKHSKLSRFHKLIQL